MIRSAARRPELAVAATSLLAIGWSQRQQDGFITADRSRATSFAMCDAPNNTSNATSPNPKDNPASMLPKVHGDCKAPSWIRRSLLAPVGIPLPVPRLLTANDPALTLSQRYIRRRTKDEERMVNALKTAASSNIRGDPERMRQLQEEVCEITYGKGVKPQEREDFLARYGCTGWTDEVLETILGVCESRGIIEMGAGHGQWARALTEAHESKHAPVKNNKKFDFCLAYDDMSSLPLNTHIYNPYTQPHHDYFGTVRPLDSPDAMARIFRSWASRGRVLMLIYPSPGDMAISIAREYINGAAENDTIIFVGEGRGGANGSEEFFDMLETEGWVLLKIMDVRKPPGDKGYEKLFVLQKNTSKK